VGLYSDLPPYQGWIRDGIDGVLLRNTTKDWINAIEALIRDSALRLRLAQVCRQRALELAGVGDAA
jgi:hypothetical protein